MNHNIRTGYSNLSKIRCISDAVCNSMKPARILPSTHPSMDLAKKKNVEWYIKYPTRTVTVSILERREES